MGDKKLDTKTLENWLWEAACKIRGEVDAPKYKDYILPLIFLKRLSDVFDDEITKLSKDYGDRDKVEKLLDEYYEARGWDRETTAPTRKTLESLDLKMIADELEN